MKIKYLSGIFAVLFSLLMTACNDTSYAPPQLVHDDLGSTPNVHRYGDIYLAGQPSLDDWDVISRSGIKTVISLRRPGEITAYDEREVVTGKGMDYIQIPFGSAQELSDEVFNKVRSELRLTREPVLLHCSSANRVGAVWLPFRVLDGGLEFDEALTEAKKIGLRTPAYQQRAETYISQRSTGTD